MNRDGSVLNVTRGTLLASDARRAGTSRERRRGLLGRNGMAPGEALVIGRCRQVHTFGMRFPIDVVFIDRAGTVLYARTLVPRRMSAIAWGAHLVMELPAGTVARTDTRAGDRVEISTC